MRYSISLLSVLFIALLVAGCDSSPFSTSTSSNSIQEFDSEYTIKDYAKDVSEIVRETSDRLDDLSPEERASLHSIAQRAKEALERGDSTAIMNTQVKLEEKLKSTVFTDGELKKLQHRAERVLSKSGINLQEEGVPPDKEKINEFRKRLRSALSDLEGEEPLTRKNSDDCDGCLGDFAAALGISVGTVLTTCAPPHGLISCGAGATVGWVTVYDAVTDYMECVEPCRDVQEQ